MPAGRPSSYTQEIASVICERLSMGESLRSVCRDENMPAISSVFKWMNEHEEFSKQYARAKQESADAMAEDILEISDSAKNDWMEKHGKDDAGWVLNGDHVQRSRLRIETRKWLMAKMKPKKYGESSTVEQTIIMPKPIMDLTDNKDIVS